MKITDEAVKTAALKLVEDLDLLMRHSEGVAGLHQNGDVASLDEISKGGALEGWLSSHEDLRSVLRGAPSHAQTGYKVKPLEWVDVTIKKHYEHANSPFGQYRIIHYRFNNWQWMLVGDDGAIVKGPATSREEAEASVKEDFERRVRELIVDGVDVAEVRRQALEEALQAIADLPTPYSLANKDGREDCCDVIRALSAAPFEKKKARLPDKEEVLLDILSDIKPHLGAWRAALLMAERAAVSSPPDIDDKAYWRHEIKALEDVSDKLIALLGEPAKEA